MGIYGTEPPKSSADRHRSVVKRNLASDIQFPLYTHHPLSSFLEHHIITSASSFQPKILLPKRGTAVKRVIETHPKTPPIETLVRHNTHLADTALLSLLYIYRLLAFSKRQICYRRVPRTRPTTIALQRSPPLLTYQCDTAAVIATTTTTTTTSCWGSHFCAASLLPVRYPQRVATHLLLQRQ
jgi:hypothetical protein